MKDVIHNMNSNKLRSIGLAYKYLKNIDNISDEADK